MDDEADDGITTEYTDVSPTHYMFKIESFSLFSKNNMDMYETNEFESRGHKWRLTLYPNGDKSRNGQEHMSIYLAISKTSPSKVFVIENSGIGECLTLKKGTSMRTHEWKIPNFPSLVERSCYSDIFFAGDQKWKVRLCPRGDLRERNKSLSIFLFLVDSQKLVPQQKVNARFRFSLRGQDGAVYEDPKDSQWFSRSSSSWGWCRFMPLKNIQDFLVNDECTVEAEVTVIGAAGTLT